MKYPGRLLASLLAGLLLATLLQAQSAIAPAPDGYADRAQWVHWVDRLARPVLTAGAKRELAQRLPVAPGTESRTKFAPLEAVGRLLCGIAPWLESNAAVSEPEAVLRAEYRELARATIRALVDPASPDRVDAAAGGQVLVDTAFLAEAMLRAPRQLWAELPPETQTQVVELMRATRAIKPHESNWLLFTATIEAFFAKNGFDWDPPRIDYAIRQHERWYKGDGYYGDGPEFHFDYYNSLVMHPMLLDVLAVVGTKENWAADNFPARMLPRAQRHAAILERLISPEGAIPVVGRSMAYRCGVFHGLAQIALLEKLPATISPAQVRCAMTAAMRRMLDAPKTFDRDGWLQIGFAGAQPAQGESYISTGSVYLAAAAFLPLGLAPENDFWSKPAARWTAAAIYAGENVPRDEALKSP